MNVFNVPIDSWYAVPIVVLIVAVTFGFAPGVVLRLSVLIYPKGHDRRLELTNELEFVPFFKRPIWVGSMLALCVTEGVGARVRSIQSRRAGGMIKGFLVWISSNIHRDVPSSILRGAVGLVASVGLLGALFGNEAVRMAAFVVVIVFAVAVTLLLLADRQRLSLACDTHRSLLARYCEFVIGYGAEPLVSIEAWRQRVYVQPNGDVREVLTLEAVALRDKVYFIRLHSGSEWDQPEKYRQNVKIIARSLAINGVRGREWNVTTSWLSTQKLVMILHLHKPIKCGERILFEVIKVWPAKCQPMMCDGKVEEFFFRTTKSLEVKNIDYSIVLPPGFDAVCNLIGAEESDVRLSVDMIYDDTGRRVFVWRTDRLPAHTSLGMRLVLK